MGVKATRGDVSTFIKEIDKVGASVDIEILMHALSQGFKYKWKYDISTNLLNSIRKARTINPLSVQSNFGNVPPTFIPSFILAKLKTMKCLGGCVFDIFQNYSTIKEQIKSTFNPTINMLDYKLEQVKPMISAEIFLEKAFGIPYPDSTQLSDDLIKQRMIRVGVYSCKAKDFIANTTVVYPNQLLGKIKNVNTWVFNKAHVMNKIQISKAENKKEDQQFTPHLIFEFIHKIQQGSELVEMSCGFCAVNFNQFTANNGSLKLDLLDGSPYTNDDLISQNTNNKAGKTKRYLSISYRTYPKYSEGRKVQVNYMPPLYVLPAKSIYYASIVRQYMAERLLETSFDMTRLLPDPIYVTFLKVMDNPDSIEILLPHIKRELMYMII